MEVGSRIVVVVEETVNSTVMAGTGFCLGKPGALFTASHVVENRSGIYWAYDLLNPYPKWTKLSRIVWHEKADIAFCDFSESSQGMSCFSFDAMYDLDFGLGTNAVSFGFPKLLVGGKDQISARVLKGCVQRKFRFVEKPYSYQAFELGFPAFVGQSGSPVLREGVFTQRDSDSRIETVHAMVTEGRRFGLEGVHGAEASVAYSVALAPLRGWLEEMIQGVG